MSRTAKRCCVLAIELRSQKMGYAVCEGNKALLDWGVRSYARDGDLALDRKLASIVGLFHPTVILLSQIGKGDHRNAELVGALSQIVRKQAQSVSIPAESVSKVSVKIHFAQGGYRNKHDISLAVVNRFPELAWRLPKKRKPWQSEPASQIVFDAVALALLHFETNAEH